MAYLLEGEVFAPDYVEHHPTGPLDGKVQQGRRDGRRRCFLRTALAGSPKVVTVAQNTSGTM